MNKLKGRIETLLFFFGFPLIMATVNYMDWFGNMLINDDRMFWAVFYISFAVESSIYMIIAVVALLWFEGKGKF